MIRGAKKPRIEFRYGVFLCLFESINLSSKCNRSLTKLTSR